MNEPPWKLIFDLQILILQFIRSERERNFHLYVDVLNSVMKYVFALNHYNYARWHSIHVDDLLKLEYTCPWKFCHKQNWKSVFFYSY